MGNQASWNPIMNEVGRVHCIIDLQAFFKFSSWKSCKHEKWLLIFVFLPACLFPYKKSSPYVNISTCLNFGSVILSNVFSPVDPLLRAPSGLLWKFKGVVVPPELETEGRCTLQILHGNDPFRQVSRGCHPRKRQDRQNWRVDDLIAVVNQLVFVTKCTNGVMLGPLYMVL